MTQSLNSMKVYGANKMLQCRGQQRRKNIPPGYCGCFGTGNASLGQLAKRSSTWISLQLLLMAALLLFAAAQASAEPAAAGPVGVDEEAAAQPGKNATAPAAPGMALTQPGSDYFPDMPAVPTAQSAVLPPEHPISKVFSCLGKVDGPIVPANYTAYEEQEEVARLLPFKLWQSTKQPPQQALTIFTTLTTDRLDMLDAQCSSMPGPLAAVVYVPVVEKLQLVAQPGEFAEDQWEVMQAAQAAVQGVFNRAEAVAKSCVLTLLLSYEYVQQDIAKQLPVNSMRNHALLLVQTPLVALLDVDLMASASMAQALADPQQVKELQELVTGQQHFVVLPAYEPMPVKERYIQHMSGAAMAVVLRQQQKVAAFAAGSDKETVQRLMDTGLLQPFDKQASPFGHKETDFKRWLACTEQRCPSYEIKPESERFEPWGVLDRQQALRHAPYDEVYRGYGKNKISNIWWLREQGFKLFVHGTAFIVHRSHAISNAKYSWRKEVRQRLPINTQKFNRAMEAMKEKKYAPKLDASTASCIQQELVRISRREQ